MQSSLNEYLHSARLYYRYCSVHREGSHGFSADLHPGAAVFLSVAEPARVLQLKFVETVPELGC